MLSLVARLCNKEKAVSSQAGRNLQLARRCCPLFFTTISTQLPSRTLVLPSLTSLCPMSARAPQSHVLSQVPLRRCRVSVCSHNPSVKWSFSSHRIFVRSQPLLVTVLGVCCRHCHAHCT